MEGRRVRQAVLTARLYKKKKLKKENGLVDSQKKNPTKKTKQPNSPCPFSKNIRSPDNASRQAGINSPCLPHQGEFGTVDNLIALKPPLSNAETSFWIIYFYWHSHAPASHFNTLVHLSFPWESKYNWALIQFLKTKYFPAGAQCYCPSQTRRNAELFILAPSTRTVFLEKKCFLFVIFRLVKTELLLYCYRVHRKPDFLSAVFVFGTLSPETAADKSWTKLK